MGEAEEGSVPAVSEVAGRLGRTTLLTSDVARLRFASRFAKGPGGGALGRLQIGRVRDLLYHIPSHYSDYSQVTPIALADVGSDATIVATVDKVVRKRPKPRLELVEVSVVDASGVLIATFFRQPWVADQLAEGDMVAMSGKVTFAYGFRRMSPSFWEKLDAEEGSTFARIVPTYPLTEGIGAGWMRRMISAALADVGDVCDPLPAELVAKRQLMGLSAALRQVHFPDSLTSARAARRRLAFDELLCLQLSLLARQQIACAGVQPYVHTVGGTHVRALLAALPFELSDEQKQAAREILHDMKAPRVMNRLLLGDVGTGKTVVAALALAACADTGTQAAMMAPTSVLARQYAERVGPLLDAAGVRWVLLTGAVVGEEREAADAALAAGEATVAFGTTALLSDDVNFAALSLVVVDEQHRFGVDQRSALRRKGPGADLLAMTATPIPRTLALSLYGDLDCSRIRMRPRAGAGVSTKQVAPENLDLVWGEIRDCVARGEAAYVVCPLVDESDAGDELDDVPETQRSTSLHLHSVAQMLPEVERLIPEARVAGLTGRMSASDKDRVMEDFRSGAVQVLVCTTVVEVGVDVPHATTMLVLDADRFGLATLHQLRGRVGRGDVAGKAYLCCAAKRTSPARRRLGALEATSDGFELAELDLNLRHEGEVLGYRQHGGVTLKIADLASDGDLVAWAHEDALAIVTGDPELAEPTHQALAYEAQDRFGAYFSEVGRL